MRKSVRKGLILSLKILLSIALLGWVLSKVHWHDFVVDSRGQEIAVLSVQDAGGGNLRLETPHGSRDVQADTLRPIEQVGAAHRPGTEVAARYVRPGFASSMHNIRSGPVAISAILFVIGVFVISYRWWRLVVVQKVNLSLWEATRLTFLGTFFNYIILGTTGGDLVKAYYLSKHNCAKTTALVTVMVDRLFGLLGFTMLSTLMLLVVLLGRSYFDPSGRYEHQFAMAWLVAGSVLVGLMAAAVFLFSRRLRRWLRLERFYQRLPLAHQITAAGAAVTRYRHEAPAMLKATGQTALAQLTAVGAVGAAGWSLGLPIPWYQYLVFVPLIYIITSVPIVPGGVGLAEGLYVTYFIAWGSQSQILAMALLARLIPMFWALPGIIVAVTGPKLPPAAQLQAEMAAEGEEAASPTQSEAAR